MTLGEVGQLCSGLGVLYTAIMTVRNGRKIDAVHESTNGKMDKLLEVTKSSSFAAGQKEQKDSDGKTG
jgi:predicted butyrate kinase (DUF1464 family)